MSITISDSAAAQFQKFLKNQGKTGYAIRLSIRISGCCGMSYVLEPIDTFNDKDIIFEDKGIKFAINNENLKFLRGTRLDFIKDGLNEYFKFNNPNAKEECGCGESFSTI